MVLDGDSMPLDLGREQRLFARYQKLDINYRYGGRCAATNCDRPAAWLQYHHEEPWASAGQQTPRRASRSAHPTTTWPTTPNPGT